MGSDVKKVSAGAVVNLPPGEGGVAGSVGSSEGAILTVDPENFIIFLMWLPLVPEIRR